jgi:hypothetical protein
LRANFKLTSRVGMQMIGLYNLTYQDFFALGFVWWDIADSLKAYAGAVVFGGENESTPLAAQQENSSLFAEIKYSF